MGNMTGRDIHVLRYFSSFISVSGGKVINVTEPSLAFCPLASHFYKDFNDIEGVDKVAVKAAIKRIIESKINDYGFFTAKRKLLQKDISVPYGASDMLMVALENKAIDAAVVVCDGAGTVVTDNPQVVQGIGARMNSLLLTSPIRKTMQRLKELHCCIVSDNALINQAEGVKRAIAAGYKKIAVTISGHDCDKLKSIRQWELEGVEIIILVVCTTGIDSNRAEEILRYGDLIWSCASEEIRQKIGAVSLLQISKQIPVFSLTKRGSRLFAAVVQDDKFLFRLEDGRQYLFSSVPGGYKVGSGRFRGFLREEKLPVLSNKSFVMASI